MTSSDLLNSVFNKLIKSINAYDNFTAKLILEELPIEKLSDKKSEDLLYILFKTSQAVDNKEMVKIILSQWERIYPTGQYTTFSSLIFSYDSFDVSLLKFVMDSVKGKSFVEIIEELYHYGDSDEIIKACIKVLETFGEQPWGHWIILIEMLRYKEDSPNVLNFCLENSKSVAPEIEKPHRIIHQKNLKTTKELVDETLKDLKIKDLSEKQMYEKIKKYFDKYELPIESIKNIKLDKEEFKNDMMNIINSLEIQNNKPLFKVLGPDHPNTIVDNKTDFTNVKNRMFIFNKYDATEDNIELVFWFTGNCQRCMFKIPYYHWAVRFPMMYGGWKGCFCSWKCVRESIPDEDEALINRYIDFYEAEMKKIGIFDREKDDGYLENLALNS